MANAAARARRPRSLRALAARLASPVNRMMSGYVAACAIWVGVVHPALYSGEPDLAQTIGLILFLGVTGSLLYRAFFAQTLELQETQEQLRAVLDHSPTRISLKDAQGRFLLVNRGFADWFGVTPARVAGRSLHEVLPSALAAQYDAADRAVLRTGEPVEFQATHPRDGRTRVSHILKFPVRAPNGRLIGVGTIGADETERAEAEAALRRAKEAADLANRAKSEFLAAMSHELRTPLNAIIGFSEILSQDMPAPADRAQQRDYARAIHDSGRHLLGIINDILDIAKIEAGKARLHEDVVSVGATIAAAVRLVEERAAAAGVALTVAASPDGPELWADEQRLRQILLNLLSNAVKFTPAGGSVRVETVCGPELTIRVADTGIGMRPEDIATALAPFGQVDGRLNRRFEGTGLGLPLTRAFVELHGGRIDLHSRPGEGTAVSVTFPASRLCRTAARDGAGQCGMERSRGAGAS